MERPTRRSATAANGLTTGHGSSNGGSGHSANNSFSSSRRRRREVEHESSGTVSDGADSDSSSVAVEMGTSARTAKASTSKKSTKTAAKGKADANNADVDHTGHNARTDEDADVDADVDANVNADVDVDADVDLEDPARDEELLAQDTANEDDHVDQEEEAPTGYATRARRERSQSVVSTTSDTSSIASEALEEPLRPELQGEKLAELEKKKQMVEDGTLAEYCRRVAEFKEERNRLLQSAEWHKNLQLKNTADLYGFEVQRAQNIWQDSKDKLKASMLQQANELLTKLNGELETLSKIDKLPLHVVPPKKTLVLPAQKVSVVSAMPKPVEARPEGVLSENQQEVLVEETIQRLVSVEPVDSTVHLLKRRKIVVQSAPVPENVLRLPFDDITSDLASIMQARDTASSKVHAALPSTSIDLHVDRRRLLCGKYVFEEGDEVVVTATVLKEDYIGVISSVSDQELFIKLSTGQKVRVAVDHIACRRCEIRPFLRGSAGIESLQSSGWVECEPF